MQHKTAYKLHKVKKQWVAIAGTVTALSVALLAQNSKAAADEQTTTPPSESATVELTADEVAQTQPVAVSAKATSETNPEIVSVENRSTDTSTVDNAVTQQNWTPVDKIEPTDEKEQEKSYEQSETVTSKESTAPQSSVANVEDEQATSTTETSEETKESDVKDSHAIVTSSDQQKTITAGWVKDEKTGHTYYQDEQGNKLDGWQTIDGKTYYFDNTVLTKGYNFTIDPDNTYYFDDETGEMWTNRWYLNGGSNIITHWYYFGADGKAVKGYQTIDGKNYYFRPNGIQLKGIGTDADGKVIQTDSNSGEVINKEFKPSTFYENDNHWYYIDPDGKLAEGWRTIDGKKMYFNYGGAQVKGYLININGQNYYFDQDTGEMWTNRFVREANTQYPYGITGYSWYYLTSDGTAARGLQEINGQTLYFNFASSQQVKGGYKLVDTGKGNSYFDPDSGDMWRNRSNVEIGGQIYNIDADGNATEVK
ncbi:KxYKxGKxW signal peptide domain-containing protein [Streptococcus dentapri]|uniref:KxYKxGKxW signal peptide domain-containing protein n=1 Tax=Streptococcus dentapri TaxID=573564 RepID=A0ABV8D088_9STRE